jgi:hypothetical protein
VLNLAGQLRGAAVELVQQSVVLCCACVLLSLVLKRPGE